MALKDLLLEQFEPDVVPLLLEFGRRLSSIEADYLMFMARKSLCLYDLLLEIGLPPLPQHVISDRTLDLNGDMFRGQRVALIDDTVLLGTSLNKAKRRLELAGVNKVSIHAFCVRDAWWSRDAFQFDNEGIRLSYDRLMTFCTAEVRAMSLMPRPYLVDFPMTRAFYLDRQQFQGLLSETQWQTIRITGGLQARHGVEVYTLFPCAELSAHIRSRIGSEVFECFEIAKVRLFAREVREGFQIKVVPLVTLKPLEKSVLSRLTRIIVERLDPGLRSLDPLLKALVSPFAQQRTLQYIFSAALGQSFNSSLRQRTGTIDFRYDQAETNRHFGPWLQTQTKVINTVRFESLQETPKASSQEATLQIVPATLDGLDQRQQIALAEMLEIPNLLEQTSGIKDKAPDEIVPLHLFSSFAEIFLRLHAKKEIPLEENVTLHGVQILSDVDPSQINHERLEEGISWSALSDFLCEQHGIDPAQRPVEIFSLLLDICNDLGIAVPITCMSKEEVVFRAYRYGEDVRFSDNELALVYDAVKGFLDASGRDSVPNLHMEKLLVLLIKIGAAQNFLEPLKGTSGVEGVASIRFELRGAVPFFSQGPRIQKDRDLWLSSHLLRRGVLVSERGKVGYRLGEKVQGNYLHTQASNMAIDVGYIFGRLCAANLDGKALLDTTDLILLATCTHPRHVAAALQVELFQIKDWYEAGGLTRLSNLKWDNLDKLVLNSEELRRSHGYEAVHSAKLKFVGYSLEMPEKIVAKCENYLKNSSSDKRDAQRWGAFWASLAKMEGTVEIKTFQPHIIEAAGVLWNVALCFYTIRAAIQFRTRQLEGRKGVHQHKAAMDKIINLVRQYNLDMEKATLTRPALVDKLTRRCEECVYFASTSIEDHSVEDKVIAFDAWKMFEQAMHLLGEQVETAALLIESIEPLVASFGRQYGTLKYTTLMYYDIVNSTAAAHTVSSDNYEEYVGRVDNFKRTVNEMIEREVYISLEKNYDFHCHDGQRRSSNDSKHLFFRGEHHQALSRITNRLFRVAETIGVQIRVFVVPCSLAGPETTVSRYVVNAEVEGDAFLERWNRLHDAIKVVTDPLHQGRSIIAFVDGAIDGYLSIFNEWEEFEMLPAHNQNLSVKLRQRTHHHSMMALRIKRRQHPRHSQVSLLLDGV